MGKRVFIILAAALLLVACKNEQNPPSVGSSNAATILLVNDCMENGSPYYEEAKTVIECEIMTAFHQTADDFRSEHMSSFYENFSAGIHTAYFGKVVSAWKR